MAIQLEQVRPSIVDWAYVNLLVNVPQWAQQCLSTDKDEVTLFIECHALNHLFSSDRLYGVDTTPSNLAEGFESLISEVPYRQQVAAVLHRLQIFVQTEVEVPGQIHWRSKRERTEVHEWVTQYRRHLMSKGRTPKTVLEQGYIVNSFFSWLPTLRKFRDKSIGDISLYALTHDDVHSYILFLRRAVNTGQMAQTMASQRSGIVLSFLRFCIQRFGINDVVQDLHGLPKGDTIDWWMPDTVQVETFFATVLAFSSTPVRDFALFGLMYLNGLRPFEPLGLKWSDVDFEHEAITFMAKGRHEVTMVLSKTLINLIRQLHQVAGNEEYVFVTEDNKKLDQAYVPLLFRVYARISGWPDDSWSRIFRHAFCTHMLAETHDFLLVNRLARHTKLETTQRYVHFLRQHYHQAARQIQDVFHFSYGVGGEPNATNAGTTKNS